MKRFSGAAVVVMLLLFAIVAAAHQATRSPGPANPPAVNSDSGTAPQAAPQAKESFIEAANEVLAQMSKILSLPVREPLKKSLRSKDEVRDYLIREEKEDKNDAQRYADDKSLEAFGLIPKGFPLDSFMLDVLTDQVAGLYDPKGKEFYIANWIAADEQKPVMAHELTHALEDQSFHIDPWIKAARPNDDAELARDAVSEGSAMAAMVNYTLQEEKMSVRDLPDVAGLIRSGAVAEMNKDPKLSQAPIYIRDELLFPYLAGTAFSQQFLKAHSGWADLKLVFENPPVSTQQIIHPNLYLTDVKPVPVSLPDWKGIATSDWKLLEENVMGEFGLDEVLKQFLGPQRADALSPAWVGDRYAVFENAQTKDTILIFRLKLDSEEHAARFCGQYSEALEVKHKQRTNLFRRPNYFQFNADGAGVFLRCMGTDCLAVEGVSRETYDKITRAMGWTLAPAPAESEATHVETSVVRRPSSAVAAN